MANFDRGTLDSRRSSNVNVYDSLMKFQSDHYHMFGQYGYSNEIPFNLGISWSSLDKEESLTCRITPHSTISWFVFKLK